MDFTPLPPTVPLAAYMAQAEQLLVAQQAGEHWALALLRRCLPKLAEKRATPPLPDAVIQAADLSSDDARLALARAYQFLDWAALADFAAAIAASEEVMTFEVAADAIVTGDVAALKDALGRMPALIRARSGRITVYDPPRHRASLLHYVAANSVEAYRQKTPPNAVEIARTLLEAGAEVDALADMYGGPATPLNMLVSSDHPARAGLTAALTELLLDHGAAIDGVVPGLWRPLFTALAFGHADAAVVLASRGASLGLPEAAGLGRLDAVERWLPGADAEARHRALALAAQHGRTQIVDILLAAGEDPNRYNPPGNHAHSTPLHQAALAGHIAVVELLVAHGARLDLRDTSWQGTPLGWALHASDGTETQMTQRLRTLGAT
jgi:ankyrin repeat protein